jgi:hypothetical protein
MSVSGGILIALPGRCETEASVVAETKLKSLEQVYFSRSYSCDDEDKRLTRLEKLVFGERRSGGLVRRLANLSVAIEAAQSFRLSPSNIELSTSESKSSVSSDRSTTAGVPQAMVKSSALDSALGSTGTTLSLQEKSRLFSYPRVTELERMILGGAQPQDSINDRLSRIEFKAFGRESLSDDLSDRTDALEKFAHVSRSSDDDYIHQLESLIPPPPTAGNFMFTEPQLTILQKLEQLERDVAGKTEPDKALTDRVDKLETEVFFKVHSERGLAPRVNYLWNTVESNTSDDKPSDSISSQLSNYDLTISQRIGQNAALVGNQSFAHPISPGTSAKHSFFYKVGKLAGSIGTVALETLGGGDLGDLYGYGYGGGGGDASNFGAFLPAMYGAPFSMSRTSPVSGRWP